MVEADDFSRYTRRGGHAWLSPAFTYPHRWTVSIPSGRDSWRDEFVTSLDDALRVVAAQGLQLDVDDWTYARMVEDGVAPDARPTDAHLPPRRYPGTGAYDQDIRPISWAVLGHARDFIGLTEAEAKALASGRQLDMRLLDGRSPITADYRPSRLNLDVRRGRVVSASIG